MDPRTLESIAGALSEGFHTFFPICAWITLAVGALLALVRSARSVSTESDIDVEDGSVLAKPFLVLMSFVELSWIPFDGLWPVFSLAFIFGLLNGLLSFPPVIRFRDAALGIISVLLVLNIVRERFSSGAMASVAFTTLALSFAAGVFVSAGLYLGIKGSFPFQLTFELGLVALSAIEIISFVYAPLGLPFLGISATSSVAFLASILFVLGLISGVRPIFTISLGAAAATTLGVVANIMLAFEAGNFPDTPFPPDHRFLVAALGLLIGYGLMRMPALPMYGYGKSFWRNIYD